MDLVATSCSHIVNNVITYGTGIAVEIPQGYVGFIYPRSSIYKYDLSLANSVGVIDSGYRNEILIKFIVRGTEIYAVGDRIAQLIIMPYPQIVFKEVDKLSTTERGNGGFGSTNK